MQYIPYGRQSISDDDINEVIKVMRSDWLTQGPKIAEFEEALASYVGVKYAVVYSNGTAALHAAYFSIGIGTGDTVISSPITFAATTNAALYCGASVKFCDIEQETANIDTNQLNEMLGPSVKLIAPVDFAGQPVDIDNIVLACKEYGVSIVQDSCHSLGAEYKGKKIGGFADATVFSFHPVKNITTGEGGAVVTNSKELYKRLRMFREHGITKVPEQLYSCPGEWHYEMQQMGYNYRLTDIQCALGLSQMKKLDKFIARRRKLMAWYREAFANFDAIQLLAEKADRKSAWHLCVALLHSDIAVHRKEIFSKLRRCGIGVQVHYIPVYYHPYYQKLGFKKGLCPKAEKYFDRCLSLPLYPAMTEEQFEKTIMTVKKVIGTHKKY